MEWITSGVANTNVKDESAMFVAQIKAATAKDHLHLESQRLLASLMSPSVTMQQYATYLRLMYDIEQVYESEVWPLVVFLFRDRYAPSGSVRLMEDLKAIGFSHNSTTIPYSLDLIKVNIPLLLGFMYVIEGSKLGGKVIYKHVNRCLGVNADKGGSFLFNTGADTRNDWVQFLSTLSGFVGAHRAEVSAIEGAKFAFGSIYDHFEINHNVYAD